VHGARWNSAGGTSRKGSPVACYSETVRVHRNLARSITCRYTRRVPKRAPSQAAATAAYENFLYHLATMEVILERGTIQWTVESAQDAQRRLVHMFTELGVIAAQPQGDRPKIPPPPAPTKHPARR
jgi:hypothetical protein